MLLVGLTGGIASGKSVVAARLAERGAVVVDADQIAREVVQPGMPALAQIVEEFGSGVITADGRLDRAALGAIIFPNPQRRRALDAIMHPAVLELSKRRFDEARDADPDAIVVYDVPLLAEGTRISDFDVIVVVVADTPIRIRRMIELRGMTRDEALHRITSQATDADRLAIADVVIDANGTLEDTLSQADALWENLRTRVGGSA